MNVRGEKMTFLAMAATLLLRIQQENGGISKQLLAKYAHSPGGLSHFCQIHTISNNEIADFQFVFLVNPTDYTLKVVTLIRWGCLEVHLTDIYIYI